MAVSRRAPEKKPDRRYLYHLIYFILSVLIVVSISPRQGKFRYEFQKGKPWLRPSLIAPWDFPVLKSDEVIARERDSIMKNYTPCFRLDSEIETTELSRFGTYLNNLVKDYDSKNTPLAPLRYISLKRDVTSILSEVYQRGILESNEILSASGSNYSDVTVIRGKVGEQKPLNQLFLQKSAYQYTETNKEVLAEKYLKTAGKPAAELVSSIAFYDFIKSNLLYDAVTSTAMKDRLLGEISLTRGLIQEGQLVISRGEIVNDPKYMVLESLKNEYEKRLGMYDKWLVIFGRFILVSACYVALYLFMYHFRFDVLSSTQKTTFILLLILLFLVITRLVVYLPSNLVFVIPFAIIPIVVRTFYDSRLALFVYLIAIMLAGFIVPNSFEFVFMSYIAGVIVIFSLTNVYRRARLFFAALMVFLSYSIVYFGIGIMQEGSLRNMNWNQYSLFAGNGVLLLLSYPLIFVFEKTFRFLSDATLFELADTNQPLLRRLAEEAPGSFQHSLQVANLAEEAAREIGANNLLVRTGALYHDIGKIIKPEYFIENQAEGFSPHDRMEPLESSKVIIGHVTEGAELARKYKLPAQIVDFIHTHHGNSTAYYFYKKFIDQNPGKAEMEQHFAYSGPRPFSKETAIVMMADAVEASSRTLQNYSEENISELVERITYIQEQDGQFSETPLTFKDVSDIKKVFVKRLLTIYHARIAYPGREKVWG